MEFASPGWANVLVAGQEAPGPHSQVGRQLTTLGQGPAPRASDTTERQAETWGELPGLPLPAAIPGSRTIFFCLSDDSKWSSLCYMGLRSLSISHETHCNTSCKTEARKVNRPILRAPGKPGPSLHVASSPFPF